VQRIRVGHPHKDDVLAGGDIALYIWDLGYVSTERFLDAVQAGAHVLQRLKSGCNPVVLASYGKTGACGNRSTRRGAGFPCRRPVPLAMFINGTYSTSTS